MCEFLEAPCCSLDYIRSVASVLQDWQVSFLQLAGYKCVNFFVKNLLLLTCSSSGCFFIYLFIFFL